jgi:hypothetical protein
MHCNCKVLVSLDLYFVVAVLQNALDGQLLMLSRYVRSVSLKKALQADYGAVFAKSCEGL